MQLAKLFSTFVLATPVAAAMLTASPASAQVATTVEEMNLDPAAWAGTFVELEGTLIADGDRVMLWTTSRDAEETTSLGWSLRVHLDDAGGLPADPTTLNYAEVAVRGTASTMLDTVELTDHEIAEILVTEMDILVPAPPAVPWNPGGNAGGGGGVAAACDPCCFVLIISGYDQPDYWNDVTQKYDYYTGENCCPENIIVLYGDGSRDTGDIANGTTDGDGNFTSGGCFPCSRANVDKAFAYIKQKMNDSDCDNPSFSFHSTGHGGGYQTRDDQNGRTEHSGYGGGQVDTDGDEPDEDEINDNDLKFRTSWRGTFDSDGDGNDDLRIDLIDNPNAPPAQIGRVTHDADGDGEFEDDEVVGTDTNEDGHIDKDDGDWEAPDLDNDPDTDSVGFDETLKLGDGEVLTDDDLKDLIEDLQEDTDLDAEDTRAELSQCFSGGFTHDLDDVTEETAGACGEGEVSLSKRGENGYNLYQKPFIESLEEGNSWEDAHEDAEEGVEDDEGDQNPVFDDSADDENPCPTDANGDGITDVDDLVAVILDWGTDGSNNGGDVTGDGIVNVDDLVEVILMWGVCGPPIDITPPLLLCPPSQEVPCSGGFPDPALTGFPEVSDDLDPNPQIIFEDLVLAGCPSTVERTWTATDSAGNASSCTQTLMMIDQQPPMIVCPPDTIIAPSTPPDPVFTGFPQVQDDCGAVDVFHQDQFQGPQIIRTWFAVDGCGNMSQCVQFIFIQG